MKFGLVALKLENLSAKLSDVGIIDERMKRTMAPGRVKEKMLTLKNWMTRLQLLDLLLWSDRLN